MLGLHVDVYDAKMTRLVDLMTSSVKKEKKVCPINFVHVNVLCASSCDESYGKIFFLWSSFFSLELLTFVSIYHKLNVGN